MASGRFLRGLLCIHAAQAWVLFPAAALVKNKIELTDIQSLLNHSDVDGRPPLFRWSVDMDLRSDYGLGGGLTYAFDPKFCEIMVPLFSEGKDVIKFYTFITCDLVMDVVSSGFRTWSANNRNIYFTDVTNICNQSKLWQTVESSKCTSSTCQTCPLAEIVITVFSSKPGDHSGARVQPVATAATPISTNLNNANGGSFRFVNLEFGTNLCWYVDNTFCSFFHSLEQNGMPVVAIVGVVLGFSFLVAAIIMFYALWRLLKLFLYTMLSTWDTDEDGILEVWELIGGGRAIFASLRNAVRYGTLQGQDGGRKVEVDDAVFAVLDVFANQMKAHHVVLLLFFLVLPVIVLVDIFLPCWQCYDFEAAAVHEIGHILGFDHPNQYPSYNFVTDRSAYNCSTPWAGVSLDSAFDAKSVMQAFLPRNPKTCLTPDDLDGLNFLYPVCSSTRYEQPSCTKANRNIGFPRLLQAIVSAELIPVLIVLGLKLLSKFALTTREEFTERKMRSDKLKTVARNKLRAGQLEQKRNKRVEAAEAVAKGERPRTAMGRMLTRTASRTAPLNSRRVEPEQPASTHPGKPDILTLDAEPRPARADDGDEPFVDEPPPVSPARRVRTAV